MMTRSRGTGTTIGVGWYRPEQWALLLSASVDRDELESTHAEWVDSAESSLKVIRATEHNPIKIDIDVEEMIAWSQENGRDLDGYARSQFIAAKTREMNQGK
jgi:hypothetical protein